MRCGCPADKLGEVGERHSSLGLRLCSMISKKSDRKLASADHFNLPPRHIASEHAADRGRERLAPNTECALVATCARNAIRRGGCDRRDRRVISSLLLKIRSWLWSRHPPRRGRTFSPRVSPPQAHR
jgi:hypothetical protein